jgi:hypothetical protein
MTGKDLRELYHETLKDIYFLFCGKENLKCAKGSGWIACARRASFGARVTP